MAVTRKIERTTEIDSANFGFVMASGNPNERPIAYASNIWDIAKQTTVNNETVDTELKKFLGSAGSFSQLDINEAVAKALNDLEGDVEDINESGNYRGTFHSVEDRTTAVPTPVHNDYCIMEEENSSGIVTYTFHKFDANSTPAQWKSEYTWKGVSATFSGTGNFKGTFSTKTALDATTAGKNDYALVENSTGYDLYRYIPTKYIVVGDTVYVRDEENDDHTDYNTPHPAIYCWTNGNTHIYTKTEDVKVRSGSASDSNTAYTTSEATTQVGGSDSDGIQQISNWYMQYGLKETDFTEKEWALIENGEVERALSHKVSTLPDYTTIKDALDLIPAQAYDEGNELADKNFVNSSIATNTGTFIGTLESLSDLPTKASRPELKNNDYAFIHSIADDETGNPEFKRYKFVETKFITISGERYVYVELGDTDTYPYPHKWRKEGTNNVFVWTASATPTTSDKANDNSRTGTASMTITDVENSGWLYEYTLNNSSFTADQWTTINSGLTKAQQAYVAEQLTKTANDKFTVSIEVTGNSVNDDDSSSKTMTLTATTKFNGSKVACDSVTGNWTAVQGEDHVGEYTKTIPYTRASSTDDRKITIKNNVFTYTVPASNTTYGGSICTKTILGTVNSNGNKWQESYTASIVYPIFLGWSSKTLKSDVTDSVGSGISNAINALNIRGGVNPDNNVAIEVTDNRKTYSLPAKVKTTSSGKEYFWLVCKGTPSIKQLTQPSVDGSNNNVSFTYNGVNLTGYKAVCTDSFDSKTASFELSK